MSRAVRRSALGVVLLSFGACSGGNSDSGVSPDSGVDRDAGPVTETGSVDGGEDDGRGLALQGRIDDAIQSIRSDTCFAQEDTSRCEWADYEVGPATFNMAKSTGEAILMVDVFGEGFFPALLRYRNRLLGFYEVSGDSVAARVLSVHVPRRLGDALVSFAGPELIPARSLAPLLAPIETAYGNVDLLYYGHGGVVFSHLIELVPEQPLVLLDLTKLFDFPAALCQGADGPATAVARAHFDAIAASLRQVILDQNVRFINASFGSTASTLAADWVRICGSPAPSGEPLQRLLHIYDPIYDLLFNSEGVITAHAATNLGSAGDFPFDQVSARYPNRVRVGFFSSLRSGLDEWGRGEVSKVDQFPVDGDADVYVNWGCETLGPCADPHYELVGPFGLGSAAPSVMTSSYVNPLGLARLINLRYANHPGEPMNDALVRSLEREMIPSLCGAGGTAACVYQDPITHRQLEIYRLQYE